VITNSIFIPGAGPSRRCHAHGDGPWVCRHEGSSFQVSLWSVVAGSGSRVAVAQDASDPSRWPAAGAFLDTVKGRVGARSQL
jgi:hypothetical protein